MGLRSHGRIVGRHGVRLAALGLMGVAAVAGALGARAMFQLKPAVPAPAMTTATRAETAALQARLMAHVRTLGAEIGERKVFRPAGLEAAAGLILTRDGRAMALTTAENRVVSETDALRILFPGRLSTAASYGSEKNRTAANNALERTVGHRGAQLGCLDLTK